MSPRAEPGGSQVAGDRPEREAGGRVAGRRGVERGGGLGEDGVSEAGEEAGQLYILAPASGRRRLRIMEDKVLGWLVGGAGRSMAHHTTAPTQ